MGYFADLLEASKNLPKILKDSYILIIAGYAGGSISYLMFNLYEGPMQPINIMWFFIGLFFIFIIVIWLLLMGEMLSISIRKRKKHKKTKKKKEK